MKTILTIITSMLLTQFCLAQKDFKSLEKKGEFTSKHIGVSDCEWILYTRKMTVYKQTESSNLYVPNQKKEEKFANEAKIWNGHEINVYPNPASTYIEVDCIQFNGKSANLSIRNIATRQEVINQKISTKEITRLDISGISSGTYQVIVIQSSKNQASKLIVKE